jgi:hypothetical protein
MVGAFSHAKGGVSMLSESLKVTGHIRWEHYRDGVLVAEHETHNLVTTAGKTSLANLLNTASAGNTWATYMGFGTSTTAEAAGDTALGTELTTTNYSGYTRPSVTVTNPANGQIQYVATLTGGTPSGGSVTVTEAGLFSASTAGKRDSGRLHCRVLRIV